MSARLIFRLIETIGTNEAHAILYTDYFASTSIVLHLR
jgi:hypothetical protein